jgi:hypothetical protein
MGRIRPVGVTNARLRLTTFGLAAAQTIFWFYTFTYIGRRTNPMGDGMEWLAAVPMGAIFLGLVLPALLLCGFGGRFPMATKFAAGFAVVALIANAVVWTQILGEFSHKAVH